MKLHMMFEKDMYTKGLDMDSQTDYSIASFYKFFDQRGLDLQALKKNLHQLAKQHNIIGTILLGEEGVNSTLATPLANMPTAIQSLEEIFKQKLEVKYSSSKHQPFLRFKVKIKKEIVTMGLPYLDAQKMKGKYIEAKDWNEFIQQQDVLVLDTRNTYETDIGTFEKALVPKIGNFRDFPGYVDNLLAQKPELKNKKIAMFCTGGIRCEKSTSYLTSQGLSEVYHLKGGILQYLEDVAPEESKWQGDCFVFDSRVSLDKHLKAGKHIQCFACRHPLNQEEVKHKDYQEGISCPYCKGKKTPKSLNRAIERQRQLELHKHKGHKHLAQDLQIEKARKRQEHKKKISKQKILSNA